MRFLRKKISGESEYLAPAVTVARSVRGGGSGARAGLEALGRAEGSQSSLSGASASLYGASCSSCRFLFRSDLRLGGVLLFPIDDKESRNKGQDLVSEKQTHISDQS